VDSTDLTPERPPLDPAEQRVADAVRGALGAPTPRPGLLDAVQARAVRRHRRRAALGATGGALALAGLVALLPLDVLAPWRSATEARVTSSLRSGSAQPLTSASLLTVADVERFSPGTRVGEVPTAMEAGTTPPSSTTGGFCEDAVLAGAPATSAWRASWGQDSFDTAGPVVYLFEELLRWERPDDAVAYVRASAATPMICGDLDGPESLLLTFELLPVQEGAGGDVGLLAAAPYENAAGAWQVRVVQVDGDTAVDLTATVEAGSAEEAGNVALEVARVALERARDGGEATTP
jgi:hypothetical protein